MNSYLAFLKKLFYAPFDEGMLRQGYERMIDEHLLNLRKIDNMKVSYIGLPHADEHLYQIIRLWFGLDGRPLSKKEIGLIEDLHGGRVVSVHLSTKLGWGRFKKLVLEIIKDCPLRNEDGIVTTFSFVDVSNQQTGIRVKVKDKGSFRIKLKKK